jgi:hypothetical protein
MENWRDWRTQYVGVGPKFERDCFRAIQCMLSEIPRVPYSRLLLARLSQGPHADANPKTRDVYFTVNVSTCVAFRLFAEAVMVNL